MAGMGEVEVEAVAVQAVAVETTIAEAAAVEAVATDVVAAKAIGSVALSEARVGPGMAMDEPWVEDFRLPASTLPEHYDLYLHPDLKTKLFTGHVSISINNVGLAPRDYFVVHCKLLTVTGTTLQRQGAGGEWQTVDVLEAFEYKPNEFWVVRTKEAVGLGKYKLTLEFHGSLSGNGIIGFYLSDYVDQDGELRVLATTKFQPTYARRAFPCFDEPSFKSTFSVTVVRPTNKYIVLSNMPVANEEIEKPGVGLTEVTFEKSVPMVTYLVCFIVCDFEYIEQAMPSGVDFRVYAPRDRVNRTQYALEAGASILQYYEKLFTTPFPLPKSDMASIPDYVSGATEHWGLITYRETSLLYDPTTSSETNKQRVCSVVAHEFAHQWFGNLVTLEWWNDVWLNEGFASYIEYKGVQHVHPDWEMASQFVVRRLQSVFVTDGKLTSHPIVKTVSTPDQITGMFDIISYVKGASVLRMLEGFVGTEVFEAGINSFLQKYAYQNAVTAQLWEEITQAWDDAGIELSGNVGSIMGTWTEQMGYPVVSVTRAATSCGDTALTFTQRRFLQDPHAVSDPSESPHGYKWDIPITFVTSKSPTVPTKVWLNRDAVSVTVAVGSAEWFKVNYEQMGFYRVNYDPDTWKHITKLCSDQTIGPADRASVLDDALALADAGLMPFERALDVTTALMTEDSLVPWVAANSRLSRITNLLRESTVVYEPFKKYVAELVTETYTRLGWLDEGSHVEQLLRVEVVYLGCTSGLAACLAEAAVLLQRYASDPAYSLPLGTKRQVLRQGMVDGGDAEAWETLWQRSVVTRDATQKDNLLYGLANSQDTDILLRFIELSQIPGNVRSQDFLTVLQYISSNHAGTDIVWDWVKANWEWLVTRYTLNDRYLGQLIPNISQYFATQKKLDEMESFFAKYPEAGAGEQYRAQALETVNTNIRWVQDSVPQILRWLNDRQA